MYPIVNCILCPTAPDQPTDLAVALVITNATSVTVSWTPPTDTSGVTGYRIIYTENGGNEQVENVSDADTRVKMIHNLTTGSTYYIRIVATSNDIASAEVEPEVITLGMRLLV